MAVGNLQVGEINVRDPYVLPFPDEGVYRLYRARPWSGGDGVDVYRSRDLRTWSAPKPALRLPEGIRKTVSAYWAPEVHAYGGKHYLFVTLVREGMRDRLGTWIFVGDSPDGPFRVIADRPVTPSEWHCLDGTLWVEDGKPYIVFCHGWTQCDDGRMMLAPLKPDFSGLDGEPAELFKATDYAMGRPVSAFRKGCPADRVTDGPFLYRSPKSGKLFMIWSNLISGGAAPDRDGRYVEIVCESASGRIAGPWTGHRLLVSEDGGHGMIFRGLDSTLRLTFHQPNDFPNERMHCYRLEDDGETLRLGAQMEGPTEVKQVLHEGRLSLGNVNVGIVQPIDTAAWVWMPGHDVWGSSFDGKFDPKHEPASLFRFRRDFQADGSALRFSVSADERFVLMLDGRVIARGPHRGSVDRWYYQTYEIAGLEQGSHRLEAVCWQLGAHAPIAQLSWRGGFILKAEGAYDAQLTTGTADWTCAPLSNTVFSDFGTSRTWGAGSQCEQVGTSFLREEPPPEKWTRAAVVRKPIHEKFTGIRQEGWRLFPTERRDQMAAAQTPGKVVNADVDLTRTLTVPARAERDLWWDLENYYCAYPELETSGGRGAEITWGWAESLRNAKGEKGDRNAWQGKDFSQAVTDTFRPDGRADALFTSPWWRCGRWCRLRIRTADEPLTVRAVRIVETRYPLAVEGSFESDDPTLGDIGRICRRAVEACAHETLFDCPFYEQQMYPGDSRIQLLVHSALTRDDALARFAMTFFDSDRRSDGLVAMNFPTRATQESATYTMCWALMHRDYLMWHDNAAFLRARMPGVRNALMGLALYENADGLLEDLPGWSFMDWVESWARTTFECRGVAPDGCRGEGAGALNSLLYLMALQAAGDVDAALGEGHLAAHWRAKADRLGKALVGRFWDEGRGLMADTVRKDRFSEHAQCLALLTGILTEEQSDRAFAGLLSGEDLARVSSYFAHYLFETYAAHGRADLIRKRLDLWRVYLRHGARTAFETHRMESRSDCHGWSACPLYFYQTAFAGVRPSAPFFRSVRIAPQPAGLKRIRATTPCPQGLIEVDLSFDGGKAVGTVTLPEGLTGTFAFGTQNLALASGRNPVKLSGDGPRQVPVNGTLPGRGD